MATRWRWWLIAFLLAAVTSQAQIGPRMSASDALVRDLDTAKSMGSLGSLLLQQDGGTPRRWADYCGASTAAADRGEFREAIRQAARALSLGETTQSKEARVFASRDMAYAYFLAGDSANAMEWVEKTETAYRDSPALSQGVSLLFFPTIIRGKLLLAASQHQAALASFNSAERLLPIFGAGENRELVSLEKAVTQLALGDAAVGLKMIEAIAASGTPVNRSRALSEWAKLLAKQGRLDLAQEKAAQAVASGPKNSPLTTAGLLRTLALVQQQAGNQSAALDTFGKAIELVVTARGRFSSQAVRSGLLSSNQSLFEDAIDTAMEQNNHHKALMWSEASRAQLTLDQLRTRYPVQVPRLDSLDPVLALTSNSQFLVYHATGQHIHGWLLSGGKVRAHTVKLARADLVRRIDDFRTQIIAGSSLAHTSGRELFDMLVRPLNPTPGLAVTVVPAGPLHYLPFNALRNGQDWWIQQMPIRHDVTLATAVAARSELPEGALFAVGNPTLNRPEHGLPGAEAEVHAIKTFFPQSVLAMQGDATRVRFMMEAVKARFVHIAAHVTLDELDPMQSAIKLSGGLISGDVTASDIVGLDMTQANLVALSACNSGMGRVAPGDEFFGFKRAVLLSGARALALTYWSVDDDATAELMTRFYRHLREERLLPSQALQKAQVGMISSSKFSQPFHWASFMLVGSF